MKDCQNKAYKRVAAGRARNHLMDAVDHRHNNPSPADIGPFEMLRTAVLALHAALALDDWSCVEEATALIEDAIDFKVSELSNEPGRAQ